MRGRAADDRPQADDGVERARVDQAACRRRDLERARHPQHGYSVVVGIVSFKAVERAAEEFLRDEFVETRNDDPEPKSRCVEFSLYYFHERDRLCVYNGIGPGHLEDSAATNGAQHACW